jgi:hypothetical protein
MEYIVRHQYAPKIQIPNKTWISTKHMFRWTEHRFYAEVVADNKTQKYVDRLQYAECK